MSRCTHHYEEAVEEVRLIHLPWGQVPLAGTALLVADWDSEPAQVVVLAASETGVGTAVDRLLGATDWEAGNPFVDCLVLITVVLSGKDFYSL